MGMAAAAPGPTSAGTQKAVTSRQLMAYRIDVRLLQTCISLAAPPELTKGD